MKKHCRKKKSYIDHNINKLNNKYLMIKKEKLYEKKQFSLHIKFFNMNHDDDIRKKLIVL